MHAKSFTVVPNVYICKNLLIASNWISGYAWIHSFHCGPKSSILLPLTLPNKCVSQTLLKCQTRMTSLLLLLFSCSSTNYTKIVVPRKPPPIKHNHIFSVRSLFGFSSQIINPFKLDLHEEELYSNRNEFNVPTILARRNSFLEKFWNSNSIKR